METQDEQRADLIAKITAQGVSDRRVLDAMAAVPREDFVGCDMRSRAYQDGPLPIGDGQTISQPSLVAIMSAELRLDMGAKVLEIGTGCGYQTAILSRLAHEVYTIEVRSALSETAQERLRKMGFTNISYRVGDGMKGWPEAAPFDAIIVTAAPHQIPETLVEQLRVGGRLLIPVGSEGKQNLMLVVREQGGPVIEKLFPVRFVPIVPHA